MSPFLLCNGFEVDKYLWLQSGITDVKQFESHLSDGRKAPPQNLPQPDSYRSIAFYAQNTGFYIEKHGSYAFLIRGF